ncbi:RHS repeat-associated core domain-containing protein [Zobellia galactanivorans]|uniref:RHS repeat-associated core domain-containing protein n=1 Tax=Zobellia galactanivorans (strain DSM 12802 / CCUG 47099 / CIP 106680 / NCIMB 13871 / Dsij) TaxID=63186 RepID=UPI0026E19A26|nr:RHS repeat-associated core domain-containing protein [Zobellia galactanivorans]MDO6811253.1 RHS repeat-associated core domain-containing protein [Zobellia galactanivorans]
MYYNRFRYYSADKGRYISQDPIRLKSGEPNFYAYVDNSTLQFDPFGLDCKRINVGDAGHHVPAVRKSKGRPFAVSRSDKTRPTFHFKGEDTGHNHWRLHDAERDFVGLRQGSFKGTNDELFDAYREAYKDLDDILIDVKSPNGTHTLGTDVTPKEGVNLVQNWLKQQGLY